MKKKLFPVLYGIALTSFTAYLALDTFVLDRAYQENTTEQNLSMFADIEEQTFSVSESPDSEDSSGTSDASASENTSDSEDSQDSAVTDSDDSGRWHHRKKSDSTSDSGSSSDTASSSDSVSDSGGKSSSDSSTSSDSKSTSNASATGDSQVYQDEHMIITLQEYYENDTKIYVADVQLTSAQYLKAAFANDTYGKNVTAATSEIAEDHQAVLAINGDYYGVQESGYVIRNGIVYRDTSNGKDLLCVYADGTMKIVNSDDKTAEELVEEGVWQAFCFGPALLEDGEIQVTASDEVGKAMASNPRTAIGMIDKNHFVFVVSDGRTDDSEGLSLYELAQFMDKLGVKTAYNLDGGGSSTMVFNGEVINNPTTTGNHIKERGVSDIVYIGY